MKSGENLRSVSDGIPETGKQPSPRWSGTRQFSKEGTDSRNFSEDLLEPSSRHPFSREFQENLDRLPHDGFRKTQPLANDLNDLFQASVVRAHVASARKMRSIVLVVECPSKKFRQDHPAPVTFDNFAPAHIVRPVATLDENMRKNCFDQGAWFVLVKDDYAINSAQSCENRSAVSLAVDRSSGFLVANHGGNRCSVRRSARHPGRAQTQDTSHDRDAGCRSSRSKRQAAPHPVQSVSQLPRACGGHDLAVHHCPRPSSLKSALWLTMTVCISPSSELSKRL